MLLFSSLGSKHNLTLLFGFSTTTKEFTHSVGSVTFFNDPHFLKSAEFIFHFIFQCIRNFSWWIDNRFSIFIQANFILCQ